MNNAGNALLSNTGNAVNSAFNTVSNSVQVSTGVNAIWFILAGIVLLLVLSYMLYMNQNTAVALTPGLVGPPADWREMEKREKREERREERREARAGFGENWCFVGEDVTGRWCVKVPQPDACAPDRLFSSRPGCELVPASPLPLGLVNKGGAEMKPMLAAAHTK